MRDVVGVLLAGGQSRRMGGRDKSLITLAGRPMLAHVIERLAPQVDRLVINSNAPVEQFAAFGLPVIADGISGFAGPLAGVLAGMRWAQAAVPTARFVATAATDTPFFPVDFVSRLQAVSDERAIALASSNGRLHPVFGLWPVALCNDLEVWLTGGDNRKVLAWVERHRLAEIDFAPLSAGAHEAIDPFFNANTPAELEQAEAIARRFAA